MPSMSRLRCAAVVALAGGAAFTWVSAAEVPMDAFVEEEACSADDKDCSLSLRQLRGEQKTVQAVEHAFYAPDEEGAEPAAAAASEPAEEQGAATEEAEAAGTASEEPAETTEATPAEPTTEAATAKPATKDATAKRTITAAAAKPTTKADKDGDDDDDEEDEDEQDTKDDDDDGDDDEDDEYDDEDEDEEEETAYGEFCCQFGQGKGATDLHDLGASCYPSAKPERYDFCDDKSTCDSKCNGTWVTGFCAFNATAGAKDACAIELNAKGTGYVYTSSLSRDVGNSSCAASESACGGCNGTWCHYVKTPIY